MSGCRGPIDQQDEIPRVHVRCLDDAEPEWLEYVEHGLEEEGVSWVVQFGFEFVQPGLLRGQVKDTPGGAGVVP